MTTSKDYLKMLINKGVKDQMALGLSEEKAKILVVGFLNQNTLDKDKSFLEETVNERYKWTPGK
jgi:hypothetical protein